MGCLPNAACLWGVGIWKWRIVAQPLQAKPDGNGKPACRGQPGADL
jgi:hypothetical protein